MMSPAMQAEVSAIGAVLMRNSALVKAEPLVSPEDFATPAHRLIWATMLTMSAKGEPIDAVTLTIACASDNLVPMALALTLSNSVATSINIEAHAKLIASSARLRRLAAAGQSILDIASRTDIADVDDALRASEALLAEVLHVTEDGTSVMTTPQAAEACRERMHRLANEEVPAGVSTGIAQLDDMLGGGMKPGRFYVLGAASGMGKTSFGHFIADSVGKTGNVLYYSVEVDGVDLQLRSIARNSGVPGQRLEQPKFLSSGEIDRVLHALKGNANLEHDGVVVHSRPGLSPAYVERTARAYARTKKVSLIVLDYIQACTIEGRFPSREQEVAAMSRQLLDCCKRVGVPIIVCAQLNRECFKRPGHEPIVTDLRESSALEHDANAILFLHRPGFFDAEKDPKEAQLFVRKNRNGPPGVVSMSCNMATGVFSA